MIWLYIISGLITLNVFIVFMIRKNGKFRSRDVEAERKHWLKWKKRNN